MATTLFLACILVLLIAQCSLGIDTVPFTPISNAIQKRAVCMDGTQAGYYYASGSRDGAKNWLVYLMGGGWCQNITDCQIKKNDYIGTTGAPTLNFTGMLSKTQDINPDFYNWNRVFVHYCDQISFLGDTEIVDQGQTLQFRGSINFEAVVEDLLAKGINTAENVLLAGRSAGALAAILHCDGFRARLPNVARVKCFSDSGLFIRAKDLSGADFREQYYASVVSLHNISSLLPTSCTKKFSPSLCLFPEYLVGDVQTPLFLLNSAFDFFQIQKNLVPQESPDTWHICTGDILNSCTASQKELIKDFGKTFIKTIMEIPNNPSRGIFTNTCYSHVFTMGSSDKLWTPHSTLRLGKNMIITFLIVGGVMVSEFRANAEMKESGDVCYEPLIRRGCLDEILEGFCLQYDMYPMISGCNGVFARISEDCVFNDMINLVKAQHRCNKEDALILNITRDFYDRCRTF